MDSEERWLAEAEARELAETLAFENSPEGQARKKVKAQQEKRDNAKHNAMTKRPTFQQSAAFYVKLEEVPYGHGTCYLYPSKSTSGISGNYGKMSYNGYPVVPHRFALMLKLECTLADLKGFDAAHAPRAVCSGGRCCHPDHLLKKKSQANRSWDRGKEAAIYGQDAVNRTTEQKRKMVADMYPSGLVPNPKLFDDPISDNNLRRHFLEMGMRMTLDEMHAARAARDAELQVAGEPDPEPEPELQEAMRLFHETHALTQFRMYLKTESGYCLHPLWNVCFPRVFG
jgi:hypothetical protein